MYRNTKLFGGSSKNMRTNRVAPRKTKNHELPQNSQISCLLTAVKKRASSNEKNAHNFADINRVGHVTNLSYDLIFKILLLLPAVSLHRSSFVCKEWFGLINSTKFIEAHTRQSKTVFIFLKKISPKRPKSFEIGAKLGLIENFSIFSGSESPRSYINIVEVQGPRCKVIESNISGFKDILATCNGLILATCEQNGGLLVINPVTRKLSALPLGTTVRKESYGFVFSHLTKRYKVVHLFQDATRYTSCEILSLDTRLWRGVDGPSIGVLNWFGNKPISAIGALHWLPSSFGSSIIVSMGIDDEKFCTTSLPIGITRRDKLVEIGGCLSFVTQAEFPKVEVWILEGLEGGNWVKRHTIMNIEVENLVPFCVLSCGKELMFKLKDEASFYAYDIEKEEMRMVEMEGEAPRGCRYYLPHVNTLTWGERLGGF